MDKTKQYKRNERMIVFAILLMVAGGMTQTAEAVSPVTYTCCVNFTTSNGTLIEDFEDLTDWTSTGIISLNSTEFVEGSKSINFTTNLSGTQRSMTKQNVNINLTNATNINFWMYVPDRTTFLQVQLRFSNGSAYTNYTELYITQSAVQDGWNAFSVNTSRFTTYGTGYWNITEFKINLFPQAGVNTTVLFDDFRYDRVARPKVMIHFDDGLESVYQNASAKLLANNQNATVYAITSYVGSGAYSNLTVLKELQSRGWAIGSHTQNHTNLTATSNLTGELNNSYDWLVANGFSQTAINIAYPGGSYNSTVIDAVNNVYVTGRSGTGSSYEIHPLSVDDMPYRIKVVATTNTTTLQSLKNSVNNTIGQNGTLIIIFHGIVTDAGDSTTYTWLSSDLDALSDYIASRSTDIDAVTIQDFIVTTIPDNTPILNKTVRIYQNGTSVLVTNNRLSDNTVDMYVAPLSENVTVNVTTWNTDGVYLKSFITSSDTHYNPTTFVLGDFPANSYIQVNKNGVLFDTILSDASGRISFGHDTYSDVEIVAFLVPTTVELITCPAVNRDVNASFTLIGVLLLVFAAGLLIQGIRTMQYPFLIAGIGLVIMGSIMIIVGYFVTVTVANGVGCLE